MYDNPKNNEYPTAIDVEGKDEVYVGRIRRDFSVDNGLNIWVVADNIRKGAATNAVQIAEYINMIDKNCIILFRRELLNMRRLFKGSGVALVTPFNENGKVNFERLKELVE